MTGPTGAWDDSRLEAAFRARFDVRAPSGLVDRIAADIEAPAARGWLASVRTSSAGLAVAAFTVAVVVVGSQLGIRMPSPGASGSGGTGSSTTRPNFTSPAFGPGSVFPNTVVLANGGQALDVLSVAEAAYIRDSGVDSTVFAVGGWYVPRQAIPCPLLPDEYQPLEGCDLNSSWLLGENELGPVGSEPAIHPVSDWRPPDPYGAFPVVFIGHFDDARASNCPAGERRQACADRFVVEQIAWTDTSLAAAFPRTAVGLPVITVDAAILVRESGLATEVAVAGWYQSPPQLFCPFIPATAVPILAGDCLLDQTWLMAKSESLIHVARASGADGAELSGGAPRGPAVNVTFAGVPAPATMPLPAEGDSVPTQVVLIGHFNDGRANLCSLDDYMKCQRRFVVDAVAWADGSTEKVPAVVDWRDKGTPAQSEAQVQAAAAFLASRTWVLNRMLIPGSRIGELEPALATSDLPNATILANEAVVWLATVVETYNEPLGNVARTYVIDSQGQVYYDAAGVAFIRLQPR